MVTVTSPVAGPNPAAEAVTTTADDRHGPNEHRRRQKALTALGRRAIAPPAAAIFVEDAAALIAETLEADRYGIAELLPDGKSLLHKLYQIDTEGVPPLENRSEIGEGISLAGYTLSMAHPVHCKDLSTEAKFKDTFLKKNGISSAICSPLRLLDRSFGAISIYSTTAREFTADDIQFMETITHLVTATVARDRAERALQDQQHFQAAVLETVEALVVVMDENGRVLSLNRACREASGFDAPSVPDRPLWELFFVPEEAPSVQDTLRKLPNVNDPVEL